MTMTEAQPSRIGIATIATRLRDWADRSPDGVALREKNLGIWREITFAEYWESVLTIGHALLALGIEPGDRVAVHSENRPEWVFADLAAVSVRAASMGPALPVKESSPKTSAQPTTNLVFAFNLQVGSAGTSAHNCI